MICCWSAFTQRWGVPRAQSFLWLGAGEGEEVPTYPTYKVTYYVVLANSLVDHGQTNSVNSVVLYYVYVE